MSETKFNFYRDLASGEIRPALRMPRGYEDAHEEEYVGVPDAVAAAAGVVVGARPASARRSEPRSPAVIPPVTPLVPQAAPTGETPAVVPPPPVGALFNTVAAAAGVSAVSELGGSSLEA